MAAFHSKINFSDAHIHAAQVANWRPFCEAGNFFPVCAASHSESEFEKTVSLIKALPDAARAQAKISCGQHPQNPACVSCEFLEFLCEKKKIDAVGECGFDFFDANFKSNAEEQAKSWLFQLDLAEKFALPIVVHSRKALPRIFADSKRLKKIPAVIFHSWPGSAQEANSFVRRGVNAFFSIGKQVLKGCKRTLDSAQNVPLARILCETDSPFQTLKGESETSPADIALVHQKTAALRKIDLPEFAEIVFANFLQAFAPKN